MYIHNSHGQFCVQYGKDFESIHNLIVTKCKKKTTSSALTVKNKEQVRHFYYRTWHKISKLINPVEGTFCHHVWFFSKCLLCLGVLCVCWFLYGPFCNGVLKLDISTTFILWTSLQFILKSFLKGCCSVFIYKMLCLLLLVILHFNIN